MLSKYPVVRRYGETDFVTSLRAIAATMVVAVHSGGLRDLGWIASNIGASGKYGVEMFFVISGFSIATTFDPDKSWGQFLIRRLFRIIPLYWLCLASAALLTTSGLLPLNYWASRFGTEIDAYNLVLHFLCLSCLDHTIGGTVLGVEWTIPVELFWYLVLPLVIVIGTTHKRLLKLLALAFVLGFATKALAKLCVPTDPSVFAKWFPTSHGAFFVVGVIAHRIRKSRLGGESTHPQSVSVIASLILAGLVCAFAVPGRSIIIGAVTGVTISWYSPTRLKMVGPALTCWPLLYIGTISYSLYLVHFPLILCFEHHLSIDPGLKLFALTYASSLLLSTALFLLVERPMNRLGAWIAAIETPTLETEPERHVLRMNSEIASNGSTKRAA